MYMMLKYSYPLTLPPNAPFHYKFHKNSVHSAVRFNFAQMRILGYIFLMSLVLQASAEQFNTFDENGKVGLKDAQGKIVIPAQYEAIGWGDGKFSIVEHVT